MKNDPFIEEETPILLGYAFYIIGALAYFINNPRNIPILVLNSSIVGNLSIDIVPCEEDGNEDIDEE